MRVLEDMNVALIRNLVCELEHDVTWTPENGELLIENTHFEATGVVREFPAPMGSGIASADVRSCAAHLQAEAAPRPKDRAAQKQSLHSPFKVELKESTGVHVPQHPSASVLLSGGRPPAPLVAPA